MKNKFTIVGFYADNDQIFSHHIEAESAQQAMHAVAADHPTAVLVAAIEGELVEGAGITFPSQYLGEEPNAEEVVSNASAPGFAPLTSEVIADFEIQDWEISEELDCPLSNRDTYQFLIERLSSTGQVYFSIYPKSLNGSDIEQRGLAGVIEVRKGKPGMSLGLCGDDLALQIDSDVHSGFYLRSDPSLKIYTEAYQSQHPATYYELAAPGWLHEARAAIAESTFQRHLQSTNSSGEGSGWELWGETWQRSITPGDETLRSNFSITFGEGSACVVDITL